MGIIAVGDNARIGFNSNGEAVSNDSCCVCHLKFSLAELRLQTKRGQAHNICARDAKLEVLEILESGHRFQSRL